ncbi:MAG: hypothetical protein AAGJ35_15365 [Myxococcota bacterium]
MSPINTKVNEWEEREVMAAARVAWSIIDSGDVSGLNNAIAPLAEPLIDTDNDKKANMIAGTLPRANAAALLHRKTNPIARNIGTMIVTEATHAYTVKLNARLCTCSTKIQIVDSCTQIRDE